jgi:hypothetical protein
MSVAVVDVLKVDAPSLDDVGSGCTLGIPVVCTADPPLIIANMYPAPNSNVERKSFEQQFPLPFPLQHQVPSSHCFTASLPALVPRQFFGQLSSHGFAVQE